MFDRGRWYSGWDGELLAEVVPAGTGWYVVVLGDGFFATTDRCYLDEGVIPVLGGAGFRAERAVWSSIPSVSYGSNPFLGKVPLDRCLKIAALGSVPLAADYCAYPLQVFSSRRVKVSKRSVLCFVITQDYQFVRWGKSCHPDRFLSQLQRQSPHGLRLLGTHRDSSQGKYLGQVYQTFKSLGDWYYFRGELARHIEQLLL